MSASVYPTHRAMVLSSRNQDTVISNQPEVKKVKRILFGPADPKATQRFIDDELKKILATTSERWNFDFQRERTLNPEGAYDWKPATPKKCIRPIKRRPESDFDTSELYCEPCRIEIVRPIPVRITASCKTQQSHITDYMRAAKRPLSELSKRSDWEQGQVGAAATAPPKKIPRLPEFSS
ncbi:uncharacterized protein LOC132705424 [Cylas formicarius]|uniref:uncharacterized protein LOC132705424 n=1 Tax=Cylas formicarius TaxID=197179 RepID=UPI00295841E4|nr:uncharacterized protein LOC132705424 [Cylas formicarius]